MPSIDATAADGYTLALEEARRALDDCVLLTTEIVAWVAAIAFGA